MSAFLFKKINQPLLHLLAIFLLFLSLSIGYIVFSVFNTSNNSPALFPSTPIAQANSGAYFSEWAQNSWTGGPSSQVLTPPWYTVGGWGKYESASNVIIDSNGIKDDGSGNSILISSIFDLETRRPVILLGLFPGGFYFNSYDPSPLYLRGGETLSEIQSAPWTNSYPDSCEQGLKHRFIQYKIGLKSSNYIASVNIDTMFSNFTIMVNDENTNEGIDNATVTFNGNHQSWGFTSPNIYKLTGEYNGTANTVTVSAPGYKTKTQTVPITLPPDCLLEGSTTVLLSVDTGTSSPPSGSGNSVDVGTGTSLPANFDSTVISLAEFQQIKLPAEFTATGSKTTDFSKITDNKKVNNFTLDIPGKNKIVFKDTLDLSAKSTVDALRELNKYVKVASVGTVEVNSKTIPALNKKATITMNGLVFVSTPEILIDGKKDTKNVVSNVTYDPTKGILTFDIAHFSTLEAVPKIEIITPTNIKKPEFNIIGRISDPNATVSGSINGVKLAKIEVNDRTGSFMIAKVAFSEETILKLTAKSKLGKVLPIEKKFIYSPAKSKPKPDESPPFENKPLAYISLTTIIGLALVLGYLVYRRRKRHEKLKAKSTQKEKLKEEPLNLPKEEKGEKQDPTQQKQ